MQDNEVQMRQAELKVTMLYLTGDVLIKAYRNTGLEQWEDMRTEQTVEVNTIIQVRAENAP